MPTKIEISHKTIIFTIILIAVIWLVLHVKDIIFLVFVSFILMSAFKPWANFLEKYRIPRVISILAIYILFILFIAFAGSSIVPPLISQSIRLGENLPDYLKELFPFIEIDGQVVAQQLAPVSHNLFKVTVGFFNNLIAIFSIIVISFYLLLGRKHLDAYMKNMMGEKASKRLIEVIDRIEGKLGEWVRAQLALMFVIGVSTFIGLSLMGIPFALPLAIIAGILEIVPTIGPLISAIPAVLVALTVSPFLALATAALYFLIQQVENNFLIPVVMKRAIGLPPLVTIIAIMIGAKLTGVIGALLAVPVVLFFEILVSEYLKLKESSEKPKVKKSLV